MGLDDQAGQLRVSMSQQELLQKSGTEKGDFLSRCRVLHSVGTAVLAWLKCIFTLCSSECSKNAKQNPLGKGKKETLNLNSAFSIK